MVVPSAATRSRNIGTRRSRTTDVIVAISVTTVTVGAAWLFTLSLLNQSSPSSKIKSQIDYFAASAKESAVVPGGDKEEKLRFIAETGEAQGGSDGQDTTDTVGEMHLSAKEMLATRRSYLMYGTAWKKDDTADLVFQAVHAGFRFIDTASQPKHYDEAGVGYGWKMAADQLGLKREDMFLQTKFTAISGQDPNDIPYARDARLEDQVRQSVHTSIRNLKTDYIDSMVLHSPMKTMEETLKVWRVLEESVEEGKIRQLGISNCYDPKTFKQLYEEAKVKPKVLQNRFYADSNFDIELRSMCKSLGVQYQSFWTLSANRKALATKDWKAVAEQKGLTPQTLMYAFMMTLGHTPLSGTKNSGHMTEDIDIMMKFQHGEKVLDDEEMNRLSSLLGIHKRP